MELETYLLFRFDFWVFLSRIDEPGYLEIDGLLAPNSRARGGNDRVLSRRG